MIISGQKTAKFLHFSKPVDLTQLNQDLLFSHHLRWEIKSNLNLIAISSPLVLCFVNKTLCCGLIPVSCRTAVIFHSRARCLFGVKSVCGFIETWWSTQPEVFTFLGVTLRVILEIRNRKQQRHKKISAREKEWKGFGWDDSLRTYIIALILSL